MIGNRILFIVLAGMTGIDVGLATQTVIWGSSTFTFIVCIYFAICAAKEYERERNK